MFYNSNQDIGALRRSNSKISSTTGSRRIHNRKTPTSIPESNSHPVSDLDHSNRIGTLDCPDREDPTQFRTPIDPINLAAEQLHRLSTQNTTTGYRPYGNQRVRDWLLETGVTWEYSVADGIDGAGRSPLDSSDNKNSGCLSDRPARRIHTMSSPVDAQSEPPTADHSTLSISTPNVETLTEPGTPAQRASGDIVFHPGSNKPEVAGAWNPEELRHSSRTQQDGRFTPDKSAKQLHTRKSLTPSSSSNRTDDPWSNGTPGGGFPQYPPQNAGERTDTCRENGGQSECFNGQQQQQQLNFGFQSERTAQPVPKGTQLSKAGLSTRQRAFPRTNPTVSRPSPGGTVMRPARFSATTLDRPINSGDPRISTGSVVLIQRNPAFSVVHFSNTDLRITPVPKTDSNGASDDRNNRLVYSDPQTSFDNASSEVSFTLSNQSKAHVDCHQQDAKTHLPNNKSGSNNLNDSSPISSSPQPSSSSTSSSSSSFSRSSSGTALTNTDSLENKQIVHSAPDHRSDTALHEFRGPRRASLDQPENKQHDFNPLQQQRQPVFSVLHGPEKADVCIDSEQPPVPPPRSASTLGPSRVVQHCTSDFYRLSEGDGMLIRSDPFVSTQRPYALYYPRYPHHMVLPRQIPHVDTTPINEGRVVSSLSRKDPARANVIPPNHRRPPPFVYQARPSYPISSHTTIYCEFSFLPRPS